ncbi:MAG: DHHA1 domain-containing protein, partial [Thermoplasmata archaeon]|nr:DHHA1 domain-containing protein [Thermoplasmata archaeon]
LAKRVERVERRTLAQQVVGMLEGAETLGEIRLVVAEREGSARDLIGLARQLLSEPGVVAILGAKDESASILIGRSEDVSLDAMAAIEDAASTLGGRGGGKPDLAQGGGPRTDRLTEALRQAEARVRELLAS